MISIIFVSTNYDLAHKLVEINDKNLKLFNLETWLNHPKYPKGLEMIPIKALNLNGDDIDLYDKENDMRLINDNYDTILNKITTNKIILIVEPKESLSYGIIPLYKKLVNDNKKVFIISTTPFGKLESDFVKEYSYNLINEIKKLTNNYILIDNKEILEKNKNLTLVKIFEIIYDTIIKSIYKLMNSNW